MFPLTRNSLGTLFFTSLKYGNLKPVFKENYILIDKTIIKEEQYTCLLIAGIASPKLFCEHAESFSHKTEKLIFPDHHDYTKKDADIITQTFKNVKSEKKYRAWCSFVGEI